MSDIDVSDYKRLKAKYVGLIVVELMDDEGFMVFLEEKDGTLQPVTDAMNGPEATEMAMEIGKSMGYEVQYDYSIDRQIM